VGAAIRTIDGPQQTTYAHEQEAWFPWHGISTTGWKWWKRY
jgi:hypothetical protein